MCTPLPGKGGPQTAFLPFRESASTLTFEDLPWNDLPDIPEPRKMTAYPQGRQRKESLIQNFQSSGALSEGKESK